MFKTEVTETFWLKKPPFRKCLNYSILSAIRIGLKNVSPELSSGETMKFIKKLLNKLKDKYCPEVSSLNNYRTITKDSLLSFWDNEYDEAWNEC